MCVPARVRVCCAFGGLPLNRLSCAPCVGAASAQEFDAIVRALWQSVDRDRTQLRFNALNLPNIDDTVWGARTCRCEARVKTRTTPATTVGCFYPCLRVSVQDVVVAWARYFLNASNHDPEVAGNPNAFASIGYHACPYLHISVSCSPMRLMH